jgi:hypothetical protein
VLEAEVESNHRITEADTKEKCDAIQRELETAQAALRKWEQEEQPRLFAEFQDALSRLKTDITADLNLKIRAGGEISEAAREQLSKCMTAATAYELAPRLVSDCGAAAACGTPVSVATASTASTSRSGAWSYARAAEANAGRVAQGLPM